MKDYVTCLDDARVVLKKSEFNKVVKEIFKNFFYQQFIDNFAGGKRAVVKP